MSEVGIQIDCSRRVGEVPPLSHAVMGNAAYNLLRPGVKLHRTLESICERPLRRRVMDTLGTGIGITKSPGVYSEDARGRPVCDFTFFDQIVDVIATPRCIPVMGIAFMPDALSAATADVEKSGDLPPEAGKARPKLAEPWMRVDRFPPKDYGRWHDLVGAMVQHCVQRYGAEAVSRWYWDFWNEPDLRFYWLGTQEELFKTYDYAAAAIREALPSARVGGIGTAGGGEPPLFKAFLEHCTAGRNHCTGGAGAPLDFITFHVKGGPTGVQGIFHDPWTARDYPRRHPGLRHILAKVREGLTAIASVPGTRGLELLLTECDIDWGTGTSIYHNPNMHYRNSEYFPAFQCAMVQRMLDLRDEFPDNPIEAMFLDTFYIPGLRPFEGARTLITGETIEKPILNGLRILGRLGPERLALTQTDQAISALATRTADGRPRIMVTNFDEPFEYDRPVEVVLLLQGLGNGRWRCRHWRIDRDHSNAYSVWLDMGRPIVPGDEQLAAIHKRQGLERFEPDSVVAVSEGRLRLRTDLGPRAVSLWELDPT